MPGCQCFFTGQNGIAVHNFSGSLIHIHFVGFQQLPDAVTQLRYHIVFALMDFFKIISGFPKLQTQCLTFPGFPVQISGMHQGFRRDAASVQAGTAQFPFFY